MASVYKKMNFEKLEVLVGLENNPEGITVSKFADRGVRNAAYDLYRMGYLKRIQIKPQRLVVMKSIGQNDPELGYKLSEKGIMLVANILSYSKYLYNFRERL